MKTDYEKQALDFLEKTGATIDIKFSRNGLHFDGDKDTRDIYTVTLSRGSRKYTFDFGQSIMKSQYYQDYNIPERTYTLNGGCRTGNYSINDLSRYQSGGQKLILKKGEAPTAYSILSCLTKYDPGTFEDFCSEFGYDTDSKKAEKTYNGVKEEYQNVAMLFTDEEIELLQEIQ